MDTGWGELADASARNGQREGCALIDGYENCASAELVHKAPQW